jgi:hypothetical protein
MSWGWSFFHLQIGTRYRAKASSSNINIRLSISCLPDNTSSGASTGGLREIEDKGGRNERYI